MLVGGSLRGYVAYAWGCEMNTNPGLGDSCSSHDDCSDELACVSGVCSADEDTEETCSWEDHCEGRSTVVPDTISEVDAELTFSSRILLYEP